MNHNNYSVEQLKIVIVGHVDHGKSTFVGRLFYDTGSLPEGKYEMLKNAAERRGVTFEWANLMDALQCERDQNITVDTAQIWFKTDKRQYVIIDAPGHKEFIKNMVTGAAHAEAALILIDANEGIQENSRRHGYLLNLLGIKQIAVLVNKMDLVNYEKERFDQIVAEYSNWLQTIGIKPTNFVPIVARDGDNIAKKSAKMDWYQGKTVIEILDDFKVSQSPDDKPLRFVVQDVYRFDERRILAGRVESGTLKVGDKLVFYPGGKTSVVKTIERWNAPSRDEAKSNESIGITLTEQIFVERGFIASKENNPPNELDWLKARIFWLGRQPLKKDVKYILKLTTQETECEITEIEKVLDASTLQEIRREGNNGFVGRYEVADVIIKTKRPIAFDTVETVVPTGRFVIVDGYDVSGGGIILEDNYPSPMAVCEARSKNIYWSRGKVTYENRVRRNGHPGVVIWLTGLSGSGKSTIATELERELFNMGKQVYVLDGDNIRHGLCSDLAFSPADRKENIRRVGEVAKLFADAGLICITAFISPYRADRDMVRQMLPQGRFVEVYLDVPLEVCEKRDVKGLYAKARAKQIEEFTGITAPYEPPQNPEIVLQTDKMSVQECVARIIEYLHLADFESAITI
ncbi:MAG: adenylyl-sulfate kinase [Verrucomicrobiia bacterium]